MEVSPDGLVHCPQGEACPYKDSLSHGDVVVECKCPYPSDDLPQDIYYKLPSRHVPQCLAEMAATKTTELWMVCFTETSTTLCTVSFDVSFLFIKYTTLSVKVKNNAK